MSDNDDALVGRILSRREVLKVFGTTGAALLVGCTPGRALATTIPAGAAAGATSEAANGPALSTSTFAALPACVVRPEMTEGPYFVDERLDRSDIRSDATTGEVKPGRPLEIVFGVMRVAAEGCLPLAGAKIDVWHCDALGVYSDVADPSFDTSGQKFLRGFQLSDADGIGRFQTIYPGWYRGRTVHIHFKIRAEADNGAAYDFTSQLFFDDALSDAVFSQDPYSAKGDRGTRNADDGIYRSGGEQLLLRPTETAAGFSAVFDIGLQID
jgi:protocatechuate 3,4-dioxygenase beta subunit